jgi:protein-disulfide isomerase
VLLRQKANLPPGSSVNVGPRMPSDVAGYDNVSVNFSMDGKVSRPVNFLLSKDGKTLAQFSKFDISADPRNLVSPEGRPARGGPANAPVLIVGFDDLECPFCARMHESLFPALTKRYGDKVRFVYKDFPLDIHPWAMRAAVDVNCMGAQSGQGYWNLVDYIHAHASDIGADPKDAKAEKTLPRAEQQLDALTREQGQTQKADMPKLEACLTKQDTAAIEASKKVGDSLGIDSTPTLFINGDKIEGAVPLDFLFGEVDDALRAEGVTPPPPYVAPEATPVAAAGPAPAVAAKK